ncbi:polysaccharide deacetylase family protein [Pararhodobacter sp. CCB-MM2]|uniref:polysaccharide deacetylase family protein n=1 Tax=Pararhodobacter sp. CCB-MM2 TaxID=1786003 RepID=UPI0013146249|nr:polysaccharide deacetylase family protein [Pararhodobacter sp. CCB-MM2]
MHQVLRVDTAQPLYSFTFDDGPDPELTPFILSALRRHRARATFFVVGEKALRYADLLRAIAADGHEIGNHTYSHRYLVKLSVAEMMREITLTQHMVLDICGVTPKLFRAPHGRLTDSQLGVIHNNYDLMPCYWSIDAKDWRDDDSEVIASRMIEGVSSGDVVLAHDTIASSVVGSAAAIAALAARGLSSVSVSELLRCGGIVPQPRHKPENREARSE